MKSLEAMVAKLKRVTDNLENIKEEIGRQLINQGWDEAHSILADHIFDGDTINSLTAERGKKSKREQTFELYIESPAALFVEFGSGILGKGHPKAADLGMGSGTFPGQTHALDPNGWWFETEDPRLIVYTNPKTGKSYGHSYGNVPVMPMYSAMRKIRQSIPMTAAKVTLEYTDD